MSTSYYFVPTRDTCSDLLQIQKSVIDKVSELNKLYKTSVLNSISGNILNLFTDINKDFIDKDVIYDEEELNIEDTMYKYKIHICGTSCGWKPLMQSNKYYTNMSELKQFYECNKSYIQCINEYCEVICFYDLLDKLAKLQLNDKSHYGTGIIVYKDSEGYEFTNIDFE